MEHATVIYTSAQEKELQARDRRLSLQFGLEAMRTPDATEKEKVELLRIVAENLAEQVEEQRSAAQEARKRARRAHVVAVIGAMAGVGGLLATVAQAVGLGS